MGFAMKKHDLQMCGIVPFTISVSQTDLLEMLISLKDYRFNADFRSVRVLKRLLHLEDSYSVVLVRPANLDIFWGGLTAFPCNAITYGFTNSAT